MAKKAGRISRGGVSLKWMHGDEGAAAFGTAYRAPNKWVVREQEDANSHWASVIGNLTGKVLREDTAPFCSVRSIVHDGIRRDAFDRIKAVAGLSTDELSAVVGIPKRTLSRRFNKFKPEESERLLRVASVFQRAIEVHEDLESARRWMSSPKSALAGLTPIQCCDTEAGARAVEDLLGRIEHGVFS